MREEDIDEIFEGLLSVFPAFRRRVQKISDDILKEEQVSRAHIKLLETLRKKGACTMSDLSNILLVSRPNITKLVDKLAALKMVIRKSNKNDRRIILIELTDYGKDYLIKTMKMLKKGLSKGIEEFTDDELILFRETIRNMKILMNRMIEKE